MPPRNEPMKMEGTDARTRPSLKAVPLIPRVMREELFLGRSDPSDPPHPHNPYTLARMSAFQLIGTRDWGACEPVAKSR